MFPKQKRVVDKKLLAEFAAQPCAVNYHAHYGGVAGHHIKTRGAGGGDVRENLITLCEKHHTFLGSSIHSLGIRAFLEKFRAVLAPKNILKLEAQLERQGDKT